MQNDGYRTIFARLPEREVPLTMLPAILCRIREERFRAANRRQLLVLAAVTVLALAGVGYFGSIAFRDLYRTGFLELLALVVADPRIVIDSGRSFLLGLFEAMPGISLVMPIAVIFIYLEGVRMIASRFRLPETQHC